MMRYKDPKVRLYFRAMPPSPHRRYTVSRSRGIDSRHPPQRTRSSSGTSHLTRSPARPCSPFPRGFSYQAGSWNKKRRDRGQSGVAPERRAFLASVSSSLICRALPSGWWSSIITVARRMQHIKTRTPSTGPVCHVASSATMPFGFNLGLHEDTGFAEGGGAVDDDVAELVKIGAKVVSATLRSNWLRWRCRGTCSGLSLR